jgi:microcin C transport system substrate-binding protein
VPEQVFTEAFNPPETDGTRNSLRKNLGVAAKLLQGAGWTMKDGRLLSPQGEPLEIEIISWDPFFERVTGPFIKNLEMLGISARQRTVDTAQWFQRMQNFEFDMSIAFYFPQSLSPGTELREYWGSAMADQPGSRNYSGIRDPAVDALIEQVIAAPDRKSKVAATRALDRVLMWNYYSIPHYYSPGIAIVYWNKFGRPQTAPTWFQIIWHMSNWWVDPEKAALLEASGRSTAN